MSKDAVEKILNSRSEFVQHLKSDIAKNEEIINSATSKLKNLEITAQNVKDLGKKVEHEALIPLGKRIYVNGVINHTGEYFLDKLSFPESYSVVQTLDSTIQHLEHKINHQSDLIRIGENFKMQLEERIKLLQGDDCVEDNLPKEIISDKGVAVKVGGFYEILEFEN